MHVQPTLYIVYNAKSTVLGKAEYVYRKATCSNPESDPACAACELTHGPSLRLTETPEWKATKARIQRADLVQVHADERPPSLVQWMKTNGVSSPAIIAGTTPASSTATGDNSCFTLLLTSDDLSQVRRDQAQFLQLLYRRCCEAAIPEINVDLP